MSSEVFDLLDQLLQYDHQDRPTAKEAMNHPYFGKVLNKQKQKKVYVNYINFILYSSH